MHRHLASASRAATAWLRPHLALIDRVRFATGQRSLAPRRIPRGPGQDADAHPGTLSQSYVSPVSLSVLSHPKAATAAFTARHFAPATVKFGGARSTTTARSEKPGGQARRGSPSTSGLEQILRMLARIGPMEHTGVRLSKGVPRAGARPMEANWKLIAGALHSGTQPVGAGPLPAANPIGTHIIHADRLLPAMARGLPRGLHTPSGQVSAAASRANSGDKVAPRRTGGNRSMLMPPNILANAIVPLARNIGTQATSQQSLPNSPAVPVRRTDAAGMARRQNSYLAPPPPGMRLPGRAADHHFAAEAKHPVAGVAIGSGPAARLRTLASNARAAPRSLPLTAGASQVDTVEQPPPATALVPSGMPPLPAGENHLDGIRIGRWLARALAADAARPPAAGASFDPRRTPAWAPAFYAKGTC